MGGSIPRPRAYRVGLRFLLALVAWVSIILAWVAGEARQADRRTAIVAELAGVGVRPIREEPTGVALLVKKFAPDRERSLADRHGRGWFARPTAVACRGLEDRGVPFVAGRLRGLPTVREVQTRGSRLTAGGFEALRAGLPGVEVVPASGRPASAGLPGPRERLAVEGLALLGLLIAAMVGTLLFLAWPLLRRRDPVRLA